MNREQKAAAVEEIAAQIAGSAAVIAVDYRGLTVAQAAELRQRLRDADARLRVVKNSLTERAAERAGAESLKAVLEGPTALAFVRGDAALAAKALADAARALGTLAFKGGLLNGTALSADDVQAIARLPAREVLNAQLVGAVAAPLTGLARALNGLLAGLAMQLKAIADEGLLGGGQASPGAVSEPSPPPLQAESRAAESAEGDEPASVAAAAPAEGDEPASAAAAAPAEGDEPASAAAAAPAEGDEPASAAAAEAVEGDGALAEGAGDQRPDENQPPSGSKEE